MYHVIGLSFSKLKKRFFQCYDIRPNDFFGQSAKEVYFIYNIYLSLP